jgi:hypothetical protein
MMILGDALQLPQQDAGLFNDADEPEPTIQTIGKQRCREGAWTVMFFGSL